MSVPTTASRYQFQGNDTGTTFAFPAIIYFATELTVISTVISTDTDTVCVLDTDYTIDPTELGQISGVNVVFTNAPATGVRITVARIVPEVQPIELVEGAGLPSAVLERQLDETIFQVQQLQDQVNRGGLPLSTPIGILPLTRSLDYYAYDVSFGLTPQLSFTPGNHRDSTGGATYIPTIGGVALTAPTPPILVVGSTDTVVYFICPIDATTGAFTGAPTIVSGTSVPDDNSTHAYQLLTNIIVTLSTIASIQVQGGGVGGSQNYSYCGYLPATDGSGHLFNS